MLDNRIAANKSNRAVCEDFTPVGKASHEPLANFRPKQNWAAIKNSHKIEKVIVSSDVRNSKPHTRPRQGEFQRGLQVA